MTDPIFRCKDLSFQYELGQAKIQALAHINHDFKSRAVTLIMGPSGSGKSTLLNLLGLIESLQTGEIHFQDHQFSQLSEKAKNKIRRFDFGFIFQDFLLFDVLTVEENISFFLSRQGLSQKQMKLRVAESIDIVGLKAFAQHRPMELSGGQRQRVAVARALAKKPKVLIADEPTASLDQKTGRDLFAVIKELSSEQMSVVMSSHDPLALEFADEIVSLKDGQLNKGEAHNAL